MADRWSILVAGSAALFLLFLVAKLLGLGSLSPLRLQPVSADDEVRALRLKAQQALSARDRALALTQAAQAVAVNQRRWTPVAGLFLRAMRADPSWPGSIEAAVAALARRRPKLLEKMLWKRLAALPTDAIHQRATVAAISGLVELYRGSLRDRVKAAALEKLRHDAEHRWG